MATTARTGFNWPNAAAVYVMHWDQKSVSAGDPSRPFRVARANGLTMMRTFVGTHAVIDRWWSDPAGTLGDIQRMLDDADANGVGLVVSNYLDEATIESLARRPYASWREAQRDVTTVGSAAWNGLSEWLRALLPRFAAHPAVWSVEVTNEPGWMLGIDDGSVAVDQGVHFVDSFQKAVKDLGARRVNAGGLVFHDPARLSDAQLLAATRHADILDHHLYPQAGRAGHEGASDAVAAVEEFARYVDRVRSMGRPLPAILGEVGTVGREWFDAAVGEAERRRWLVLAWGFDSWDDYEFNDARRPEVLARLR